MRKAYSLYSKFFFQRSKAAFLSQHTAIPPGGESQTSKTLFMWLLFFNPHLRIALVTLDQKERKEGEREGENIDVRKKH